MISSEMLDIDKAQFEIPLPRASPSIGVRVLLPPMILNPVKPFDG
jgi:hypothetical protein